MDRLVTYSIEALCLALFMIAAAAAATLLQHPESPVSHAIHDGLLRRILMGTVMGATAVALIYSPFGARSGAHMNPAVTLAYLRLGKIRLDDAAGYVCGQFFGGVAGIVIATLLLGGRAADPSVNFIATLPSEQGVVVAFVLEAVISFLMMTLVLQMTSRPHVAKLTGIGAGLLVATFIAFESPYSGMSMNPARTLGSNVLAGAFGSLWIYFTAPVLGMQIAAGLTRVLMSHPSQIGCPRLYHPSHVRCVFGCGDSASPAVAVESRSAAVEECAASSQLSNDSTGNPVVLRAHSEELM